MGIDPLGLKNKKTYCQKQYDKLIKKANEAIYGFVRMLQHYHLPFDRAFDLCVKDLILWAKKWHTTYEMTNLIIFVLLFLILIGLNCYAAWYIFHY